MLTAENHSVQFGTTALEQSLSIGGFRDRVRLLREEAILGTARQLLMSRGFHAMAMDDVADGVGISKATLYQHFASKDDLAAAVLLQVVNETAACFTGPSSDATPVRRLVALLTGLIQEEQAAALQGIGIFSTHDHLLRRFIERPDFAAAIERFVDGLKGIVVAAQAAGEIDPAMTPDAVVALLLSLGHGAGMTGLPGLSVSPADLSESLVNTFLRGVRPADDRAPATVRAERTAWA